MKDILDAGSVKYINMAENLTECKQAIVKRLEDDYNDSPLKSGEMLDMLILILRGEKVETPTGAGSSRGNIVAVQPQPPVPTKNTVNINSATLPISNQTSAVASAPSGTKNQAKAKPAITATIIKKPLFWIVFCIALAGIISGLYFAFFQKEYNALEGYIGGYKGPDAFTSSADPELVGAALPSTIAMYEGLLAKHPKRQGLLLTTGSLLVMYANAFIQGPAEMLDPVDFYKERLESLDRAKKLYLRGTAILYSALEYKFPGFSKATFQDGTLAPLLKKCKKNDVPLLYWTAIGSFAAYSIDIFDLDLGYSMPEWSAMMARAYELDPDFNEGTIDEFYIQYYASLPESWGGDMVKADIHFKRALEKSGGLSAKAYVSYAKYVCANYPNYDYDAFLENLEKAMAIDPDQDKSIRLFNILAQREAKHMLDTVDDYFPVPP